MTTRSPEHDLEHLLAHAGWLTSLARRLVGDAATADDLVQDTWCAVLRAPRRDVVDARGWLATALSNLVRSRSRAERARRWREHDSARPEAVEGPDVLAERTEAQRRLLTALLALEEPYRGTLFARYIDGRKPIEIARAQGVNESTVRSRLARGHERLRERLEREGGERWALALAPLLSTPAAPPSATPGLGDAGTATGSWLAGWTAKVVLASALLGGGWLFWSRGSSLESTDLPTVPASAALSVELSESTRSAPLDVGHALEREAIVLEAAEPATDEPVEAPPPAGTLDIVVERDGVPAAGVGAWIADSRLWPMLDCLDIEVRPPEGAHFRLTDAAGVAGFREIEDARYTLALDASREPSRPSRIITSAELHAGYRYVVALGTATVSGTVFDSIGRPRAGVGVQVCHERRRGARPIVAALARTDERGAYRIEDLAADRYTVVMEADGRFDGNGEVERKRLNVELGQDHRVDFGGFDGRPRWSGRVRNAFDEPFLGTGTLRFTQEREGWILSVPIALDGTFDVAFTPGTWKVMARVAGSPDRGFDLGLFDLGAHDRDDDIVVPGTRITGQVVVPDGRDLSRSFQVSVRRKGHDYPAAFGRVGLRSDGTYAIDGLEAGTWLLGVFPHRLVEGATVEVEIAEGEPVVHLDLRLAQY